MWVWKQRIFERNHSKHTQTIDEKLKQNKPTKPQNLELHTLIIGNKGGVWGFLVWVVYGTLLNWFLVVPWKIPPQVFWWLHKTSGRIKHYQIMPLFQLFLHLKSTSYNLPLIRQEASHSQEEQLVPGGLLPQRHQWKKHGVRLLLSAESL